MSHGGHPPTKASMLLPTRDWDQEGFVHWHDITATHIVPNFHKRKCCRQVYQAFTQEVSEMTAALSTTNGFTCQNFIKTSSI